MLSVTITAQTISISLTSEKGIRLEKELVRRAKDCRLNIAAPEMPYWSRPRTWFKVWTGDSAPQLYLATSNLPTTIWGRFICGCHLSWAISVVLAGVE